VTITTSNPPPTSDRPIMIPLRFPLLSGGEGEGGEGGEGEGGDGEGDGEGDGGDGEGDGDGGDGEGDGDAAISHVFRSNGQL